MNFNEAVDIVLKHEGGYVNDPADAGGETNYGISKQAYPDINIRNLTKEQAKMLYKRDYWDACKCDQLPDYTRLFVFDTAVNMGIGFAKKMLQVAVGAVSDGVIGPKTLAAARRCNQSSCILNLIGLRWSRYHEIAKRGKNAKFLKGWLNRLADIARHSFEDLK